MPLILPTGAGATRGLACQAPRAPLLSPCCHRASPAARRPGGQRMTMMGGRRQAGWAPLGGGRGRGREGGGVAGGGEGGRMAGDRQEG